MKWIPVNMHVYNNFDEYEDQKVFAIDKDGTVLVGNLFKSAQHKYRINCEDDNVFITDVQYIVPVTQVVEELRKLLPKK